MKSALKWYLCFAAAREEASDVRCNRVYLALPAGVSDNDRFSWHGHRRRNLCTVGRLRQLRGGEGDDFIGLSTHIPLATDRDGVLLLKNCLRAEIRGRPLWRLLKATLSTDMEQIKKLSCRKHVAHHHIRGRNEIPSVHLL